MSLSVTLYAYEGPEIKVSVVAMFNDDAFIVDGYDIGKKVEEFWGDSDYEYNVTVNAGEMPKLYEALDVSVGDKEKLLAVVAEKFSGNHAYSSFRTFLETHNIPSFGHTWT